jgi:hypothetical protein
MRIVAASALLLVMAIYYIITVATTVFMDDFIRPRSLFVYYLATTLIASFAALAIDVGISAA